MKKSIVWLVVLILSIIIMAGCGAKNDGTPNAENDIKADTSADNIVSADDWISVSSSAGKISIPPAWSYDIYTEDDMEWINISGEGQGGPINMTVGYIFDLPFEKMLEESISYQDFQFDNGVLGYMIDFQDSIMWVYADSWWNGIMLAHGGDRALFIDNEDIISAVAATLNLS